MKKVLFLTSNFPPNRSVGTQRVTKILKYIDTSKFEFHILTLKEKYYPGQFDANEILEKRLPNGLFIHRSDMTDLTSGFTHAKSFFKSKFKKTGSSTENMATGAKKTTSSPRTGKPAAKGFFTRLAYSSRDFIFSILEFPDKHIGWLKSAVEDGVRIVKENKIDVLFTTAPPHSLFVMAWLIKRKTGVKLVLDYRDPWALSRWDKGSALKTASENFLEKRVVRSADAATFVTEKLRDEYARHYKNYRPENFHVFYNGYDADDFEGLQIPPNNGRPIRVVHLGSLYKKRNPEKLFLAVKNLKKRGILKEGDIRFEFIGFVARELSGLYDLIHEHALEKFIEFKENIAFHESIRTMYAADALLIVQPFTDLQVPAKLLEYMFTRRPILALAEHDSATDMVIRDGRLGFTAASQDVAEIEQAIINLLEHLKNPQFTPNETYIESFNMKNYIGKLEKILLEA